VIEQALSRFLDLIAYVEQVPSGPDQLVVNIPEHLRRAGRAIGQLFASH